MKQRWPLPTLVTLALVWGSTWIANEIVGVHDSPLRLLYARYLFASLVLAIPILASRVRGRQPLSSQGLSAVHGDISATPPGHGNAGGRLTREQTLVSLTLGITMFAIPNLLLVWSARHGAGGWTPLLYAALPLGLGLAAGQLLLPSILGLGAMLALLNGSFPLDPARLLWTLPLILAVAMQGWSLVYARRHLAVAGTLLSVMIQLQVAGVLLLWVADLSSEPPLPGLRAVGAGPLMAFAVLAVVATAAAYPLYYLLLGVLQPAQVAVCAWWQTLVAVGESAWLLRQRPGWMMIAAAATLVACSFLLLRWEAPRTELNLHPPVSG